MTHKLQLDSAAVYVACYVLLRKDDTIAFVQRANTGFMDGYYGLPAGRVEWNEPYRQAAAREAKEEVGVDIKIDHLQHALTLHRRSDDSDWIDVFFEVDDWQGEVVNAEPDKHSGVAWLPTDNLPDNVMPYVAHAIQVVQAGKAYAEHGWES